MNTNRQTIIVAADGGGTGCRAAAGTLEQGILAQTAGGAGNVHSDFDGAIHNLTSAIDAALDAAGLRGAPNDQITAHLGVAGAHSEVEMAAVQAALPYGRSAVTGDRATSVRGVLGEEDGYVLALGTGTIIARQDNLAMRTIGGWGFELSDHASGAWLGRRVLEEAVLAYEGMAEQTALGQAALQTHGGLVPTLHFGAKAAPGDFAQFAREVITFAKTDDPLGLALMSEGAAFVTKALRKLGFQDGDILALAGGVGPHYAPYLPPEMTRNLRSPKGNSLEGAFAMACHAAKEALG